jgi:outer membrane protein
MSSRRTIRPIAIACGAAFAVAGFAARAETLNDAIALAYQSNPTLQGGRASQRALDETYVQARAGYEPTAGIQASVTANNSNQPSTLTSTPGSSQSSQATLTLTQPLYTGGLVAAQVDSADAYVMAGRENLRQVEQTLLQNVIQAYVNVRRDQESLAIAQENLKMLVRQLDESKARFEVGEITRTDVAETEARVAAARAQLSTAQAQLAVSRAGYASVVGQNPGDLAPEPPLARLLPDTVDRAFDVAEHNNPQLRQADYTERGSAAKVAAAKAQTRPTVSLRASLGYTSLGYPASLFTPASSLTDFSHDVSATAVVNVPLFTGGMTSSQIRQAAENNNVDRIAIEAMRRQVLLAVSQAWNQLLGARANLKANEEEVKAANIAFEGTREEAQVGLRTTLDVLITEQDLSDAQLALVNARHDEYIAAAAVLAAMGALSAQNLSVDTPLYDPKANFNRVKRAGAVPWDTAVDTIDRLAAPPKPAAPPLGAPDGK